MSFRLLALYRAAIIDLCPSPFSKKARAQRALACPPAADLQERGKPRGVMKFCDTLEQQRKLSPVEWSAAFLNYKLLKVRSWSL